MPSPLSDPRLHVPAIRWPGSTIRVRLTATYASLFLITGGALLTIGYQLVANTFPPPERHPVPEVLKAVAAAQHLTVAALFSEQAHKRALALHQLLIEYIIVLAGLSLLSVALGWLTATRALRPLRRITATTKTISARNLDERLDLDGPADELKELGDTIDQLLVRLERSFQSQRRFVANASHELRTPLALEQALLESALTDTNPSETTWRTTCERALATSQHQARLLEALLALARSEQRLDRDEPIDLAATVSRVLAGHGADAQRQQITVSAELDPAPTHGDPRLIERLVDNLADNALRHNDPRGSVKITTKTVAGDAVICVSNTGPDVRAADIDRLLQPFQRDQADRTDHTGGLGLGLSIVHAIVVAHGAKLEIGPRAHGGLTITVRFAQRAGRDAEGKTAHGSPRPSVSRRAPLSPNSSTSQGSAAAE